MLTIENAAVAYARGGDALERASLDVSSGTRHLVCGAAGSGKTTLLHLATGIIPRLITPERISGQVRIGGAATATADAEAIFGRVGYVAQSVEDQLWDLSLEDLIAFPLENRAVPPARLRERMGELIDGLKLRPLSGRRVLTLSGGERRMAALAAALATRPDLVVLDEPTTGLDPEARARLVAVLNGPELRNAALLMSAQDPGSLRSCTDIVTLLSGGTTNAPERAATLWPEDDRWRAAGILPPRHAPSPPPAPEPGAEVFGVAGLASMLARNDGQPVLRDVGFSLRAGEVVGLVGRNGAGKTTLIRTLLRLAQARHGRIILGGQDAGEWSPARRARSIAYLPQEMRRILFNMSVAEEIAFAMTAKSGMARDPDVAARCSEVLARYGLADHAETNPFALSARQQAVLGLVCAEAAGAPVAVLDEPLLGRDIAGRAHLERFLRTARENERAVLMVSHDLEMIDSLCPRLLVLDAGRITFDGPTRDGWSSPGFGALNWPAPAPGTPAPVPERA
ncbi:ABC transporter ATP-binding protein [Salipiger mucosus]|uniref:ABC transporter ATP-binding protein n=1 Tax=Salipiger mucosus DSM 16094 TaxID=1123237 RepID=S9REA4_9RHOB|nr:ABC transporter ATP-binding protein [Salipiger mucosus]EPX76460.1 ABC transporter ATP-binding protein [Salipiger mucosus DSM 16094]